MTPRHPLFKILTGLIGFVGTLPSSALINPSLQPADLAGRYVSVLCCRVTAVDKTAMSAVLKVEGVAKGEFAVQEIALTAADGTLAAAILSLQKGQALVAYAGKTRSRHENDILYYTGQGVWYLATMDAGAGQWKILSNADKGKESTSGEVMFGTFNGEVESLWEMMQDHARGLDYFPAVPLTRFSSKSVGTLAQAVRGVAVYDVTGDGKPDLFACSAAGNRLYVQDQDGVFVDRSEAFGLAKTNAVSCSFADVDADGDADLLLDGILYRQTDGKFTKNPDVPGEGGCLSAAFMEYNGDGYPDIVVSRRDGGLALFQNPGGAGGAFADKSAAAGLSEETNGAGKTGTFEVCDWDLDGRNDLIYAAGQGYLLWQNPSGVFEASELGGRDMDFDGGTAAFGTIVRPARPGVYLVAGQRKNLISEAGGGTLADFTQSGNEIQDPVVGLRMALAEDLNADGTVDLYAASGQQGSSSFFVANRGYGSFMSEEKYRGGKVVPPAVYNQPAWGLAAGDVNGDGAVDLLVGGDDGKLTLLVNETLTDRPLQAGVGTTRDVRKQIQTRIVTVKPAAGKGLTGCRLTLLDDHGKPLAHRWIGSNIGVGCCGPAQFSLALRQPGNYSLLVRRGDGTENKQALIINEQSPRHQVVSQRL